MPHFIHAAILHVSIDGSKPYTVIQTAINAAAQNDTVLVHPGTYRENIILSHKSLKLWSLNATTADSTYIAQTIINGNQTGSCIQVTDCDSVTIRGLYLTNGSGSVLFSNAAAGGGILCRNCKLSIINCRIIGNAAFNGAGLDFDNCAVYLSATIVAMNHAVNSSAIGAYNNTTLTFDPVNRCSVYLNTAVWGNDFRLNIFSNPQIYLDKFTVPNDPDNIGEFIYAENYAPYGLYYNSTAIIPRYADFYVSPTGDDQNSGLTPSQPLRTIAMALIKVKADSLHPQTIHLANGIYSNLESGQYLPINLKSYVTIEGESKTNTILDGNNRYPAMYGWSSEQGMKVRNFTIRNCISPHDGQTAIVECISRLQNSDNVTNRFSLELENLRFYNCQPVYLDDVFFVIYLVYPDRLVLRNIDIEECRGDVAINLIGSNITAENIRVHRFRYGPGVGENCGTGMAISTDYRHGGRPNYFTNLEFTNCENEQTDWATSAILQIGGYESTTDETENYFINCTIADNYCRPVYGGAVTLSEYAKATFINSIVSNNYPHSFTLKTGNLNNQPNRLRFLNTLLGPCALGGEPVYSISSQNTIEYYGTNLNTLPDFNTAATANPFVLSSSSPCLDAGTMDFSLINIPDSYSFPAFDLSGTNRIYGSQVDLGAYEWSNTANPDTELPVIINQGLSAFPNPFRKSTNISFDLTKTDRITLSIYNAKGQHIKTLTDKTLQKGSYNYSWDGKNDQGKEVTQGIYIYRLCSGKSSVSYKCLKLD